MINHFVTKKGLIQLRDNISQLLDEMKECNKKIGHTVSLDNDLRENPEFMSLRNKAEYEIPNKIKELNDVISDYILVEDMEHIINGNNDYIHVGHKVTLSDENGNQRIINILGYGESNPEHNIVSYLTPIAQKLIDLEINDEVTLPYLGKEKIYVIDEIEVSPFIKEG
ncbi:MULTISPECIES: GreA/GreB family elongation factor [unclassified Lonepinella]|uniref:GreA/GreB family elongation factor n=1 Tax=unclassified Lonepinella TaxID=2642006 RepID=UPI0036DA375A